MLRRRLFTLCSALSLLLFVAVCVAGVRSFWVCDYVRFPRTSEYSDVMFLRSGWFTFTRIDEPYGFDPVRGSYSRGPAVWDSSALARILPIEVPLVFPAFALSFLPLCWASVWLEQRRVRRCVARQICPRCGYDLRASPGRCPECGAAPAASSAAAAAGPR